MGLGVGTISLLIGGFILATFLALFNYLAPSGRVTVIGRVVEVTPNVTGQIVATPVKPNVPVKKDDVLFQIDLRQECLRAVMGRKAERRRCGAGLPHPL
ncbi:MULTISPECIES: biotin/lipoyl-binding protein [unclassified Bradyrhizobium]|uniref:biotin/lipoyl-binding protein n=1 Tax=unclassified Bradyrhizobium TaxID=2631580 RepID=UPI0020B41FF9|nr:MULTISPECIES: biotin/lipoyl-binding protein [unclassified Bradyrhizobium]MCP3380780.1 biotin/lipoyl-binding protein [Bradyrhizobium sp. CCGUVB4N]MCP3441653.1 biotin/lipoyl-binding protein [Bradyrhizobium sp. CCGUVB14]